MHARHPFTAVERYSATARLFHWLTALLVVVAYIVSVSGPETRVYSALNDFSRGSHELLGMSVFALTLVRLCWRTIFPSPNSRKCQPGWRSAPSSGNGLFMRCSSWCRLQPLSAHGKGHPLTLLAVRNIQPWLAQSPQLGLALGDIHGWLGDALMWLAGLHVTAALYHHFWRRNTVLLSMLPGR